MVGRDYATSPCTAQISSRLLFAVVRVERVTSRVMEAWSRAFLVGGSRSFHFDLGT